MGDPRGFLTIGRSRIRERAVSERLGDFGEFTVPPTDDELRGQAARCMDCGVPFCHRGCPVSNLIPEWNDLVYKGRLDEAVDLLHATNNFPEITGRVCPAPCEASCVLNLEGAPVHIKAIEKAVGDRALDIGLEPGVIPPSTGYRVAVVGSGPAGLAAAQQLARQGHAVTVFERDDRIGGLLRYGIPDFKLDRAVLDARLDQLRKEGVTFVAGRDVSTGSSARALTAEHDAVVLACGARKARELAVPGRELAGVHLAMDFLTRQNKKNLGDDVEIISAAGKRVVVLGGGDTGADCVGTSHRHGAASVLQLELMPRPPGARAATNPWPEWPLVLRTSSSHEEGGDRDWAIATKRLSGEDGRVAKLHAVRVDFVDGRFEEVPGSELEIECDLVLLAMGFTGPERGLPDALGLDRDARGNVATDASGATSVPGVFACGDVSRGASLVVWAIADGRRVAAGVDRWVRRRAGSRRSA